MHDARSAFQELVRVLDTVLRVRGRGVPPHTRRCVAADILLVAARKRTAALIDAFAMTPKLCEALVSALQSCAGGWARELVLVALAPAGQVFFVNRRLMSERWPCARGAAAQPFPVFVEATGGRLRRRIPIPPNSYALLQCIAHGCAASATAVAFTALPHQSQCVQACSVAACGWLLEYPIVYALAASGDAQSVSWAEDALGSPAVTAQWADAAWEPMESNLRSVQLALVRADVVCAPVGHAHPPRTYPFPLPHHMLSYSIPLDLPDGASMAAQAARYTETVLQTRMDAGCNASELPCAWMGPWPVNVRIHMTQVDMDRVAL
ncbi:hypothetical protein MSPP1_002716 [Malassezia sp. CBS 17886]|nr:hypothetical protein MSPP1_002716 [Malassezia sp. CBS 17886]